VPPVNFRSTARRAPEVSLRQAVLQGLAPDGGLYVPAEIPRLAPETRRNFRGLSFCEMSFHVLKPFLGEEVPGAELRRILADALDFPVPVVTLSPEFHILELFHGPTLAFKDFGARVMARLMAYFIRGTSRPLTVLAATSGDTGGAVTQGFFRVPGTRVVILYPAGRVSEAQERQFATLGENITALEVSGSFDDCQRLAKLALADAYLRERLLLTSANSINIARLLPQMLYYFTAFAQLPDAALPVVFSVPSGNFGNLTAGLLAWKMGLTAERFIAATNSNDVVPEYLRSGSFLPRASQQTLSNAMDVGNPSNFARLADLFENDVAPMRRAIWGCGFSDEETLRTMRAIHERFGYLADPHTAVGILGWETFRKQHPAPCAGIILATAHPAKFSAVVTRATGVTPPLPESLARTLAQPKLSRPISAIFDDLKQFLLSSV
jgi:threonine synthase